MRTATFGKAERGVWNEAEYAWRKGIGCGRGSASSLPSRRGRDSRGELHNIHLLFMRASLSFGQLGDVLKQQKQKYNNMKINQLAMAVVCGGLMTAMISGCATDGNALESQAKISKAEAQRIALEKVPNGVIKEGELEKEKGLLIWSFDIATPGTKNITEVAVNAVTGKIVAVDVETPEDQAKE